MVKLEDRPGVVTLSSPQVSAVLSVDICAHVMAWTECLSSILSASYASAGVGQTVKPRMPLVDARTVLAESAKWSAKPMMWLVCARIR